MYKKKQKKNKQTNKQTKKNEKQGGEWKCQRKKGRLEIHTQLTHRIAFDLIETLCI